MYQPKTNLRNPRNTTIPILETQIRGRESSPHWRAAWVARGLSSRDGLGSRAGLGRTRLGLVRDLGRASPSRSRPRFWWFFFSDLHLLWCSGGFFSPISIFSLFSVSGFFFSGSSLMFWSDLFLFIRVINRVLETRFPCNRHVEKYATSNVIRA